MRKLIARTIMLMMMTILVLSIRPTPARAASVPGVPTDFTVISYNEVVTLAWSEPASDGGSVITSYRVYMGMIEDGLGILEDVTEMNFTHSVSISGQPYYYAVSALNAEGEGEKTGIISVIPKQDSPLMTLIYVEDYITVVIINVGEGVYFDISGERHNATVVSITGTSTLITVSSGSQNFTMKAGDSENVDVNSDGTDEYVITCKTINSAAQTVEFSFTKASKKSGGGIPGFELWTLVVGGLVALYVLNYSKSTHKGPTISAR